MHQCIAEAETVQILVPVPIGADAEIAIRLAALVDAVLVPVIRHGLDVPPVTAYVVMCVRIPMGVKGLV